MNRTTFLSRFPNFGEGAHVYTSDGKSLGKIISYDENSLTVEKGHFLPRDFALRYDEIAGYRNDALYLNVTEKELKDWLAESFVGMDQLDTKDERPKGKKSA